MLRLKNKKERRSKLGGPSIALVGNPNVGKSVLFGLLTGKYVIVSNYPGTTVTVSKGKCRQLGGGVEVVDTPGVNSLVPQSEDERVARDILLEGEKKVIQVVDSKNLRRGLIVTTQLAEMELPVVLDLNMWDECLERGIDINTRRLQGLLGIPVVKTVATERRGIGDLISAVPNAKRLNLRVDYGKQIEDAISKIERLLPEGQPKRAISLMLLSGDISLEERFKNLIGKESMEEINGTRDTLQGRYADPLSYIISKKRGAFVDNILREVLNPSSKKAESNAFLRVLFFFFLMPLFSFGMGYKVMGLMLFPFFKEFPSPFFLALILKLAGGTATCILITIHLFRKELRTRRTISEVLGNLTMHPVAAYPILIIVLWLVYKVVAEFGAGISVDFLENKVFGQAGTPSGGFDLWVGVPFTSVQYTMAHVPFQGINYYLGVLAQTVMSPDNIVYRFFLGSKAGVIQMGLTYSIAIILPIVSFFLSGVWPDGRQRLPASSCGNAGQVVQEDRFDGQGRAAHGYRPWLCNHGNTYDPDNGEEEGEVDMHPVAGVRDTLLSAAWRHRRHSGKRFGGVFCDLRLRYHVSAPFSRFRRLQGTARRALGFYH